MDGTFRVFCVALRVTLSKHLDSNSEAVEGLILYVAIKRKVIAEIPNLILISSHMTESAHRIKQFPQF